MQTYLWVIFDLLNTRLRLLVFLFKQKKELLLDSFSTGLTGFLFVLLSLCLRLFRNWLRVLLSDFLSRTLLPLRCFSSSLSLASWLEIHP